MGCLDVVFRFSQARGGWLGSTAKGVSASGGSLGCLRTSVAFDRVLTDLLPRPQARKK